MQNAIRFTVDLDTNHFSKLSSGDKSYVVQ